MAIRINRVYTKQGDSGDTSLIGGVTVRKSDLQIQSYGEVDELNSILGVVKEIANNYPWALPELPELIERIQQELFDLGAELATPLGRSWEGLYKVTAQQVESIEKLCDFYGQGLPELKSFILPGGNLIAAELHVARAVARRVERALVKYFDQEIKIAPQSCHNPEILRYINRLNDLFFVLARWSLQKDGQDAPLWQPFAHRLHKNLP